LAPRQKKPAKAVPKKKPRKNPERGLQYRCQQWLDTADFPAPLLIFHVPNERIGGIGAIVHFKRMGVMPGVADYLAFLYDRRAAAIELKHGDGEQTADQKKFQRMWEARGNAYFLVRTLEEFQGVINGLTLFA
jgi:hypothetical protein